MTVDRITATEKVGNGEIFSRLPLLLTRTTLDWSTHKQTSKAYSENKRHMYHEIKEEHVAFMLPSVRALLLFAAVLVSE